jgi:antibiotic biosynthesis monooxygenase (ABM) superfamily enzyme
VSGEAAAEAVGTVITRRVPSSDVAAFEAGLRELIDAASRQPGHLSTEVLRGTSAPGGRDYYVVYRFADERSLRAWEVRPIRRELVARIDPLGEHAGRRELTGLEAWFDLPPAGPQPSRQRMALLTWLAIWPIVSVLLRFAVSHLSALPFLARTALITATIVLATTYLVMPRLTRLLAPWLRPTPIPR